MFTQTSYGSGTVLSTNAFTCIHQCIPDHTLWVLYYLHFIHEETKAQRSQVICPGLHSQQGSGTGIGTQIFVNPQSVLFTLCILGLNFQTCVPQRKIRAFMQGEGEEVEKNLDWVKLQGKGALEEAASLSGRQHSAVRALQRFSFTPHEHSTEQASQSPFQRWAKCGSNRLSNLLTYCLLLVHGGFRFKLRSTWTSTWCCVRLVFLSQTCPQETGVLVWGEGIPCASFTPSCLPSSLLSILPFPPACSPSTTPSLFTFWGLG